MERLSIEALDLKARGIASREGKIVFIEGALPGEEVSITTLQRKPSHETAQLNHIVRGSSQRVTPPCPHFGVCGGCSMQHLEPAAQVAVKQRVLEDSFQRIGSSRPRQILAAIHGPAWGYRYRARLSARALPDRGVILGFRERNSSYVADIRSCAVLPPRVSELIDPLRSLIAHMSRPDRLPQIEVAVGENDIALVLRHLVPLTEDDHQRLRDFATKHSVKWWLQAGGPQGAAPLQPTDEDFLIYSLPEFGLTMRFRPTDFTQVNPSINRALVSRAISLLEPQENDRVLDLFCGLGNFTLALARRSREVIGVEFSASLLARAEDAAAMHGLQHRVRFLAHDLFARDYGWLTEQGRFDRILIDPPREGAEAMAQSLARLPTHSRPRRIVYVSCNPTTLARDAAILKHQGGYRLLSAGVVNMFPHTAHVESIAVFE